MKGSLTIVGLGPGRENWMTGAAQAALQAATDILGYESYVRRLAPRSDQRVEVSGNREELHRARRALELAVEGRKVALVSGGDPGVFGMAAAVFEAVETGPPVWRTLDITVEPGVTGMLAAAARFGAPLGHDFCAISLSDSLKPWTLIERRLRLAARADFVIALYNPASKARSNQLGRAYELLRGRRSGTTPVMLARAVGRSDEDITVTTLGAAGSYAADMRTLVIIGSSATRIIPRPDRPPWVYTPRFAEAS